MEQQQSDDNIQEENNDLGYEEEEEQPKVKIFQTSMIEQSIELKTYFNKVVRDPFNNFCIDCKNKKTSHAIIWLGAYVCGDCANKLVETQGGNRHCYIKDIFGEQWDDYQLKALAYGGNKNLFEYLQGYELDNKTLLENYNTPCLQWYRQQLVAQMDGMEFTKPKPPKNWQEQMKQTEELVSSNLKDAKEKMIEQTSKFQESVDNGQLIEDLKASTVATGTILAQNASVVQQKTEEMASKAFEYTESIASYETYENMYDKGKQLKDQVAQSETLSRFKIGFAATYLNFSSGAANLKDKIQTQAFGKQEQSQNSDDKMDVSNETEDGADSSRQPQNLDGVE